MDTTDSAYGDKLVRLDTFDTAVAVDPSAEDDAKRRFMTLILQTAHRNNGNIGHVLRATNTSGEVFAVKLLKDNAILSGQAPTAPPSKRLRTWPIPPRCSRSTVICALSRTCADFRASMAMDRARTTRSSSWSGSRASRSSGAALASARSLGRPYHPDGGRRWKRRASRTPDDPGTRKSGRPSRPVARQYHVPYHQSNARAADRRLLL